MFWLVEIMLRHSQTITKSLDYILIRLTIELRDSQDKSYYNQIIL